MNAVRAARAAPIARGADAAHPAARALAVAAALIAMMSARAGDAAAADIEAGRRKAVEVCAPCHGPDGNATIPGTPSLAGQPVYFTHWQLIKFKDGRR